MRFDVCANIEQTLSSYGESLFLGHRMESAHPSFLEAREDTVDEHLRHQPAFMAYFESMKRTAFSILQKMKRQFQDWENELFVKMKESLAGQKATIKDVETRCYVENKLAYDEWHEAIAEAEKQYNLLDVYCEAIRQKSYVLREISQSAMNEKNVSDSFQRNVEKAQAFAQLVNRSKNNEE